MKLHQRSYGGKIFRPKPHIYEDESLLVILSTWGVGDQASRIVDEIVKYVSAATGDVEVTSPFEYVTSLSKEANYLRVATLLANDFVFRGENRSEYTSGYEVIILLKTDDQLTWAHVGGPHLLLKRAQRPLVPLVTQYDLSTELSKTIQLLPPLPSKLLGMDSSCQIVCGDTHIQTHDQLVLTSCSYLPPAFWVESQETSINLEKATHWMTQADPETPFWIGTVDL